ncbi:hypothetical protein [Flavihumibacter petaseus]|uniref:Uncharacterized protein n=1 Tax=Flavihumibacter petaseus NBRC 106054 TaxID=1220578 RepID=A0A0E9N7W0_9BACT|nr:hypothetical protein [Flavihumibacter petaseus]GAO45450.1 hypothetical protein FPE01S_05_01450 [Flavihumibacter petaseus NBRC 106054]
MISDVSASQNINAVLTRLRAAQVMVGLAYLKTLYDRSGSYGDKLMLEAIDGITEHFENLLSLVICGQKETFIVAALFDWLTEGSTSPEEFVIDLLLDYNNIKKQRCCQNSY